VPLSVDGLRFPEAGSPVPSDAEALRPSASALVVQWVSLMLIRWKKKADMASRS